MVQASIKKEFKRIFMTAGYMFYDVPSGQEMYNLLPLIGKDDFCILVSVSGTNKKIVEAARTLQAPIWKQTVWIRLKAPRDIPA